MSQEFMIALAVIFIVLVSLMLAEWAATWRPTSSGKQREGASRYMPGERSQQHEREDREL